VEERKVRCAVSSALERQATVRRRAAESSLEARRRAAQFMSARREKTDFADDVARRIGACSQAHVRFVQQEHRDLRRLVAATSIQRIKDERRQRNAELERDAEARRKAAVRQAEADRFVTSHGECERSLFHTCNKRLLRFCRGHVLRFFNFFLTRCQMQYKYAEIQRKTLVQDALAMIFIDFGLLRSPY